MQPTPQHNSSNSTGEQTGSLGLLSLLSAVLIWSYWMTFLGLAGRWSSDPTYSHGFLVPFVAAALIWHRRLLAVKAEFSSPGLGIALIASGVGLRLCGARFFFEWLEVLSILPSVAGICVLYGGCLAWRRSWPGIVFLAFMLPLPYWMEGALAEPLQYLVTFASTYLLQTVGYPAVADGNVIIVNETRVDVTEACNGLQMMVAFFAISTAVACFIRRPAWERGLIVVSAVPIALICNVTRVTAAAVLFETVGVKVGHVVFHDLAGWLMMPMALALLGVELWVVSRLLIAPPKPDVVPVFALGDSRLAVLPRSTTRPAIGNASLNCTASQEKANATIGRFENRRTDGLGQRSAILVHQSAVQ